MLKLKPAVIQWHSQTEFGVGVTVLVEVEETGIDLGDLHGCS